MRRPPRPPPKSNAKIPPPPPNRNAAFLDRDAARRVATNATPRRYPLRPSAVHTSAHAPYHRRTSSSAPSDFAPKSEGALEEVRRWYGACVVMIQRGGARYLGESSLLHRSQSSAGVMGSSICR